MREVRGGRMTQGHEYDWICNCGSKSIKLYDQEGAEKAAMAHVRGKMRDLRIDWEVAKANHRPLVGINLRLHQPRTKREELCNHVALRLELPDGDPTHYECDDCGAILIAEVVSQ
jgi:hypothetical protein